MIAREDLKKVLREVAVTEFSEIDIPLSSMIRIRVYEQGFEDGTSDLTEDNCTQTVQSTEVYTGSYSGCGDTRNRYRIR